MKKQTVMKKKNSLTQNTQNFYFLLALLLITITLLKVVTIYCTWKNIKKSKKYLLLFYVRNSELKQVIYW